MSFVQRGAIHQKPSDPVSTLNVVLYTRQGCHLCDDAKQILLRHGTAPREVDIDEDSDLVEKFGQCVPVVEIDGKVRFRGRVDEMLLRRLLVRRQS